MKKIIVTGAAGIIGTVLTAALAENGYSVYAITRPGSSHNKRLDGINAVTTIELALEQIDRLPAYIDETCAAMIHLAWSSDRQDFVLQRQSFDEAIMAVEVASCLGCEKFIGIGSQAEYGPRDGVITEDTAVNPVTPYGAFKTAACVATRECAKRLNIGWVWGRIFSVYGGNEPPTSLLYYLISALKRGVSPTLTEARQNWDFLYVRDAAESIIALLERGLDGEIYNIANGNSYELRQFVEIVHNMIAPKVAINYGAKSAAGVYSLRPSVAKIRQHTGWQAKTSFRDGIRELLSEGVFDDLLVNS